MKRNKLDLKLKRRLDLVRTTIRDLTPTQLPQINGGTGGASCLVTFTCTLADTCTEFNCPCGNQYTLEEA